MLPADYPVCQYNTAIPAKANAPAASHQKRARVAKAGTGFFLGELPGRGKLPHASK